MIKSLLSIFKDSPNSFEGQKEEEKVLLLLRRHLFVISVRVGFFALFFLIPIVIGTIFWSSFAIRGWSDLFLLASSIWYLGLWLAIFHSLTIYTLNTVIVTDRRVVSNDQQGLFNRKVSELHSNRIQDVSAHTNGIIETFLQFGNIVVQTAASERQFTFRQIPNPNMVKDTIMQITASQHSGVKAGRSPVI